MSVVFLFGLVALLTGCQSLPPGAEPGPHGTMAYFISVEASPPGAHIEVNGEFVGDAPVTVKLFGDPDGTFHNFGSYVYSIRALPLTTNQFPQIRAFRTGRGSTPEDLIPKRVYFDMNVNMPVSAAPGYVYPPGAPVYTGPPVYLGAPMYLGPSWRYGGPWYQPYYYAPRHYGPRYYGPHRHW